jgi:hypothetical protein
MVGRVYGWIRELSNQTVSSQLRGLAAAAVVLRVVRVDPDGVGVVGVAERSASVGETNRYLQLSLGLLCEGILSNGLECLLDIDSLLG